METKRTKDIKPFLVMDVLERANELTRLGHDIIHLEVGEPDFDTPAPVVEAVNQAMRDGQTHYTHSLGLPALREAICEDYRKKYGVDVSPDRVLVTNGTSPAMFLLFSTLLEPDDEVIISDPHYACYPSFVKFAEGVPVTVPVYEEDGFQFRVQAIRERMGEKTRGVFINSPSNPTGNLLSADRMQRIVDLGLPVISDEIYHGLVYGEEKERSILEFTDRAFVFNGFSKLYAMTGLRLGYLIAPQEYMRTLQKLAQNFFISANTVSQLAGIAALTRCDAEVEEMKGIYNQRRVRLIQGLKDIGFGITVEPTGAFYVLANAHFLCEGLGCSSYDLAFDILEHSHVGVTPGIDFGPGAEGYIRFSYANSLENIEKALERLDAYISTRLGRS